MKRRTKKKLEKRGGLTTYNVRNVDEARRLAVNSKTNKKMLRQAQSILSKELNDTINIYRKANISLPKTISDQVDLKKGNFGNENIYRNPEAARENIRIMQQVTSKTEMGTHFQRDEFLKRFKSEIAGNVSRQDMTRNKYDISGSLFRNEMQSYAQNINIEQLLKIYDIIDQMERDKRQRYGKYKSGDFDAMVVAASKGFDPTRMTVDEFLDKVYDLQKQKEKEKDEYVLSQAPKTTLFE